MKNDRQGWAGTVVVAPYGAALDAQHQRNFAQAAQWDSQSLAIKDPQ
jgi:hypothetical protein